MPRRGGRRKKSRTQAQPDRPAGTTKDEPKKQQVQPKSKKGHAPPPQAADPDEKRVPRTMIVRRGATDKRVQELVRELRRVMAPHTAERLKERPGNSLKDFVHAAQPLGVSHLLVLGQQKDQVNLRVARLPGGPTLSFKIRSFSLVRRGARAAEAAPSKVRLPTLLRHSSCWTASAARRSTSLCKGSRSRLFAPIDVSTVKVADMRRVVLFHKDGDGVEMRHYAVQASAANVSKPVKRVVEVKNIPDLSKLKDISEYVTRIDPGSDSEGEDAVAPMAGKFGGRGNVAKRESKIKLVELGPRLRLRLYTRWSAACVRAMFYTTRSARTRVLDAGESDAGESDGGEASVTTMRMTTTRAAATSSPTRMAATPVGRAAAEEAAAQGREAPVRAVS